MHYRRVRRRWRPALMYVQGARPPAPTVGTTQISAAQPFKSDGFVYPRPEDNQFDYTVRIANIGPGATLTQRIFTVEEGIKGGVIRRLGYGFNEPHGFMQVRISILVNGMAPSKYLFKHFETGGGPWQGSLPPFQIGSVNRMTNVFIPLSNNAVVDLVFANASTEQTFVCSLRLWGWLFGD